MSSVPESLRPPERERENRPGRTSGRPAALPGWSPLPPLEAAIKHRRQELIAAVLFLTVTATVASGPDANAGTDADADTGTDADHERRGDALLERLNAESELAHCRYLLLEFASCRCHSSFASTLIRVTSHTRRRATKAQSRSITRSRGGKCANGHGFDCPRLSGFNPGPNAGFHRPASGPGQTNR